MSVLQVARGDYGNSWLRIERMNASPGTAAGPCLVCEVKNLLTNDNIAEVLATHEQWNYVKALTGERAGVEGWVSISFITATPCPGSTP
jgi:hypothetical protein